MNSALELLVRSLAVGGVAAAFCWLCPAAWRGRVRRAVPVVAFIALLLLLLVPLGIVAPVEVKVGGSLAGRFSVGTNAPAWLAAAWALGALVCLLRLAWGTRAIRALLRDTRPVPGAAWAQLAADCARSLGLRGGVRLRLAGPGFIPSAAGLFRRTVLLPDEALGWTPAQRRIVLLHELGHFRRGDLWTHALGRLACALHWFNPFAWALQRQLAVEREFAVDELVVSRGAAPADYATVLWEMATASRRPGAAAGFLGMAREQPGKLEQRVRRILAPAVKASRLTRLADATLCATAALALFACAACRPAAALQGSPWTQEELDLRLSAQPFPGE